MILSKNQTDFVLELKSIGNQSTGIKDMAYLPVDAQLIGIVGKLGTAGITGSQVTDIHAITASGAGTTIFSNAQKITYSSTVDGAVNAADTILTPTSFAAGTLFALENDSVHSGTPAVHQSVFLIFRRKQLIPAAAVQTPATVAALMT